MHLGLLLGGRWGHLEGPPAIVDEDSCCVASICVHMFKQPRGPIKNMFLSHVEFLAVRFWQITLSRVVSYLQSPWWFSIFLCRVEFVRSIKECQIYKVCVECWDSWMFKGYRSFSICFLLPTKDQNKPWINQSNKFANLKDVTSWPVLQTATDWFHLFLICLYWPKRSVIYHEIFILHQTGGRSLEQNSHCCPTGNNGASTLERTHWWTRQRRRMIETDVKHSFVSECVSPNHRVSWGVKTSLLSPRPGKNKTCQKQVKLKLLCFWEKPDCKQLPCW